ncbi:hypothetical protein [Lachnoclostridium sp.]|uniref:hypothetical protein n=1 Tax=Lachnoclostridium sp. TaxID=2028282 RepID=UPI00289C9BC7|nr:hypothetical protein [Lachnoclostridium sp.]
MDNLEIISMTILSIFLGLIFVVLIIRLAEQSAENKKYLESLIKKYNCKLRTNLIHVSGLPISNHMECKCFISDDKYIFVADHTEYVLDKSKLTKIELKKDIDIQKQAIPNTKGVIASTSVFGTAGALMAKNSKTVDVTTKKQLLIFNFIDKDEHKQLIFDTANILSEEKAISMFNITKDKVITI